MYDLCRRIVTKQRSASIDSLLTNERPPVTNQPSVNNIPSPRANNNVSDVASPKQQKYLFALGRTRNLYGKAIRDLVFDRYKKPVDAISRSEISVLIDEMKQAAYELSNRFSNPAQ